MNEITVQKSGRITPVRTTQKERGAILAIEEQHVSFPIRRTYVIHGIDDANTVRGGHAHYKNEQVLFVLEGAFTLHLDDGKTVQDIRVSAGDDGIRLGALLWHGMSDFTHDCIVLVLASEPYDESDYIRNYEIFKNYVGTF